MVIAVWSVKGGVGVTSVASLLAIAQAERAQPSVLVDLCGDVPAVLGMADLNLVEAAPGVAEWCRATEPTSDALGRIEWSVRGDLTVVPRGTDLFPADASPLVQALAESQRHVVVDCGRISACDSFRSHLARDATISLLVVRACFVNLRAVQQSALVPTAVVVVQEPGRQLGRADVEAVAGAPVIAQIEVDSSIARSIDAGLASARLPRGLLRRMARVPDIATELARVTSGAVTQRAR